MQPKPNVDRQYFVDLVRNAPPPEWGTQKRMMKELAMPDFFIDHVEILRWELVEGLKGRMSERVN